MFKEFNNRLFEGDNGRFPRKGDSFNYKIFGIVLGHSLLHGGPGFYHFHPWVFQVFIGVEDSDELLLLINKEDIPRNAGSDELIEFIVKLDVSDTQEEVDAVIDKHLQILNCSRWDPSTSVTLKNKNLLVSELVLDEVVRKRMNQVKSIREGLQMSGFLHYMETFSDICREIFVFGSNAATVTADIFMQLIKSTTESDFEKIQSRKFFDTFVHNAKNDTIKKILRFATGFSVIPPWGLGKDISIKFLIDDDTKLYPEAMTCFGILYLPTVHSTQEEFEHHFIVALEIEGVGFSAGC